MFELHGACRLKLVVFLVYRYTAVSVITADKPITCYGFYVLVLSLCRCEGKCCHPKRYTTFRKIFTSTLVYTDSRTIDPNHRLNIIFNLCPNGLRPYFLIVEIRSPGAMDRLLSVHHFVQVWLIHIGNSNST